MGIYFLGPLCGPLLAPVIGGALSQRWGWRATMWFMAAFSGACLTICIVFLPETLESVKTRADQKKHQLMEGTANTPKSLGSLFRISVRVLKTIFVDPFNVVWYLRRPAVLICVSYASLTYGILFVLEISIQRTFSLFPYRFNSFTVGLLYLADSLGYIIAGFLGGQWMDRIMQHQAVKAKRYDGAGNLMFLPEDRVRENAVVGALSYPIALLWYGWTAEKGVHWSVPVSHMLGEELHYRSMLT